MPTAPTPAGRPLIGILCLVVGICVISLQDLVIKLLSDRYPVHQALAIRAAVGAPLLLLMVARSSGLASLASPHARSLTLRGLIMLAAYTTYYLGLAALPLAICAALFFVSPIFITLLSSLVLKEEVGWRRWTAVSLGFVGVLVVLRPTADVFDPAALLPVAAGFAYAVSAILARRIGQDESATVMAFYGNAIYLAGGLGLGALFAGAGVSEFGSKSLDFLVRPWSMPPNRDLMLLATCGIIAAAATVLLTQAYRMAPASIVAPYEYTALAWSLLYGWAVWGEFPDPIAWTGIALIIASGLYTLLSGRSA